jgi:hypothetical protein
VPDLSPRYEEGPLGGDEAECGEGVLHPSYPRRIGIRTDDHEIVVHEVDPFGAESFLDELLFEGLRMDHGEVDVTALRHLKIFKETPHEMVFER